MAAGKDDLALLVAAARAAGRLALDYQAKGYKTWEKPGHGPVTEADLAIDEQLKATLGGARPGYGWLSEETADDPARLGAGRLFVVDPIDGTRAYVKGRPYYAVSVAVVEAGRPIAGVVYNPAREELYAAAEGAGATLNEAPIAVSGRGDLSGARLVGSVDLFRSALWPTPWPALEISPSNSIAYALCQVASGAQDGSVSLTGKSDWDIAAADLIVAEAGGIASTHLGEAFAYNRAVTRHRNVVSAGPALHRRLMDKLKEFRPPEDVAARLIG
ncbi:inositol monophosphatase family protein [Zavarzinia compransoris]|uniref:3'(2'),5'-bisphosphate nucleotidase CysQ n=1 Tax=Zavarzinia compransoris TaxID=1264899 RepID=A0A317DZN5_9PROT|nr:3'(2'),5'-bisphosphate nucleotidase CysQ [Zavarzinia compransoris]PWR19684.1 3'(2'),5'-bisphosphate nucleotidase CysQ [Zavarzinia compransoris]TDP43371.1 myo-inositol-1(or 4)-monophosphatase [Zavarzinia compransoris]